VTLLGCLVVTLGGMSVVEFIGPRVRLAIVQWPDDAPRGTVSMFCIKGNTASSYYTGRI
jgi:hypothetical protein